MNAQVLSVIVSSALLYAGPTQSQTASVVPQVTQQNLYQACLAEIRIVDGAKPTQDENTLAVSCVAYFRGFIDGSDGRGKFCVPKTATSATVARVYVNWMKKNPTDMDKPRIFGAVNALTDAYPCH